MDRRLKLFICAAGIFTTYFYYGIIQERITRGNYGGEKFTCILSLVFIQCLVNYIYAIIALKQGTDTTRTSYYMAAALTYLIAMLTSNLALRWVNYPTQVIGKSGKPIAVMLLSAFLGTRSYPLKKYFFVLLIVIGVALFMYKDGKSSTSSSVFGYGELMILFSLLMDGLTADVQNRMKRESRTTSGQLMINMNKWSVIFLCVPVFMTGDFMKFLDFVKRHPGILWEIVSFSAASAIGQNFIFSTVANFGPLDLSIITTTRKFFTVLGSVVIFGNDMLPRQWFATILVFLGLFLDSYYR